MTFEFYQFKSVKFGRCDRTEFCAYNKIVQKNNKRVTIIEGNKNKNVLRLENRFKKDVKNLVKQYQMNAEALYKNAGLAAER